MEVTEIMKTDNTLLEKMLSDENLDEIKESIRNRTYKPLPVRRVEIPKPDGGVRKLGVPAVLDRFVQQAIAQVLIPIYEPKFSDWYYVKKKYHAFAFGI